jgi:hypothetical protein
MPGTGPTARIARRCQQLPGSASGRCKPGWKRKRQVLPSLATESRAVTFAVPTGDCR